MTPTQELIGRVMRIVRTCPEAASEVLELMFLVSQIEAATHVDRDYRDARRVVSRLRNPLWEMGPADRAALLAAAETIRRVCGLDEGDIPVTPTSDAGERARVERSLATALEGELDAAQIARVTGVVAAALQQ
ncbi:hypothetical protein AFCDBAGC_0768 [Methylobacterium cerastii]|uniref:Uncharacterized protein n=2 Tax=Methylobacterium TaxID=407 RepID=A0ABQ4QCW2_9HYPH|nr:hypothetical protein FV229_17540 [Methylobacterium sp. WL120]TXM75753.1 hypothetical protein FV226_03135 [Methylobacterium sp. WL12]TXN07047.1 hypothetical protein FV222_03505 [Methylobacterium sp. WL103]TXN15087.1 hypothetical protein FV219_02850 [Methylobacterium sp. WL122]TXN83708.1 hypothetical protein FV234_05665 [Methylobacterium sp. WL8]GJD42926.1 hypothetical protein AFCDBAGC_0768 [Methylobacterium cerastii]